MTVADDTTERASAALNGALGAPRPRIGLVLGSGLGALAEALDAPRAVSFGELPGFPQATVSGHAGRFVAGRLAGRDVLVLAGRLHYYEGHRAATLALPVRLMRAAGCTTLVLTNAAGSLNPDFRPGSLMVLNDHINWAGVNPLIGPNDDATGPRFFDMCNAYDAVLRTELHAAADACGVALHDGVYVMYAGPNFETPAEIRAFARLGGDAVGMSTVPECLAARHCGMRVAAVSTLTNMAAGLDDTTLSHEHTLSVGAAAADSLGRVLTAFLRNAAG